MLCCSFQLGCGSLEFIYFCQIASLNKAVLQIWDLTAIPHHWFPLVFWDLELRSMYIMYKEVGPMEVSESFYKVML